MLSRFESLTSARLDVYVSELCDITRSRATKLIEDGCVLVNNSEQSKNYKLKTGKID